MAPSLLTQLQWRLGHWLMRGQEVRQPKRAREATVNGAAILRSLPDPILIARAGGVIIFSNDAADALFGQPLQGARLATLRHPNLLDAIEIALEGQQIESIDFSFSGKVERHLNARLSLIRDGEDDSRRVIVALRDITEIRQSERMRGDFVANVSHELRSPLASIAGFVETLRGPAREDPAARDRFLGIMAEQTERMTNLIEDLLSLSRIELKEHRPPTEPIDLQKLVGSVVNGLELVAEEKSLKFDVLARGETTIRGDRDELYQLLQNLCDNAVKYAKAESAITLRLDGSDGKSLFFSINNKGDVIDRDHLPRLTERFYRVDTARSRALGGTGLGLAIVKHVANRHQADLKIESNETEGTTFSCRFPF